MRSLAVRSLLIAAAFALLGCKSDKKNTSITGVDDISWSEDASSHRTNIGQTYTYVCTANGTFESVWGTDTYTDDSSICTAAVHAGKITRTGGGTVTIEMRAGQAAYLGSARNGVTTLDYGSWPGSFVFK